MSTRIIRKGKTNFFYINGRGFNIENWESHKSSGTFTQSEIDAFENYIKQ